jgi:XTP/dITP diphosphohydrolase
VQTVIDMPGTDLNDNNIAEEKARKEVVLATANAGKLKEFQLVLRPLGFEPVTQASLEVKSIEETGLSFIENAILKARHAAKITDRPALADDSGLAVDALDGAPGIYSARYAGSAADDQANLKKLLQDLRDIRADSRTARFHCVLAFMRHARDPVPIICHASWEGRITREPRGANGFGYDPIFYVPTHDCTAAELPTEIKNALSHRGQAIAALVASLKQIDPGLW